MVKHIYLPMKKLSDIFNANNISLYPHWVIDVQGAELDVLKGSGELLKHCHSLEIEITSRNLYDGGSNAQDVIKYLNRNGFISLQEHKKGSHEDIIFIRINNH